MNVERLTAVPRHPERAADAHKGDCGRVLVVAGSRGMAGAAALCGLGALRGGAGLVVVNCPSEMMGTITAVEPGLMTFPWPDRDGYLIRPFPPEEGEQQAAEFLQDEGPAADWPDVLAVGPGLGRYHRTRAVVRDFWANWPVPLVVDADGLSHLSCLIRDGDDARGQDAARVLTPHPGEFARLLGNGITTKNVQAEREGLAVRFAQDHNVILLLKGARTLVTDGKRLFENRTGNPGMATGGCGDVLTGLIAALIGQGMKPFEAACCGAHLHGRAGDLAAAALSQPGLIASDLPRFLATAFADPGYD